MIDHEHDHIPHMVPHSPPGDMNRADWVGLAFFMVLIAGLVMMAWVR